MEEIYVILERHDQKIKTIERDLSDLKEIQKEIKVMNESLVTLATELKHTNAHLSKYEKRIDEIDARPRARMQQTLTAIIAALAGSLISTAVGLILLK